MIRFFACLILAVCAWAPEADAGRLRSYGGYGSYGSRDRVLFDGDGYLFDRRADRVASRQAARAGGSYGSYGGYGNSHGGHGYQQEQAPAEVEAPPAEVHEPGAMNCPDGNCPRQAQWGLLNRRHNRLN